MFAPAQWPYGLKNSSFHYWCTPKVPISHLTCNHCSRKVFRQTQIVFLSTTFLETEKNSEFLQKICNLWSMLTHQTSKFKLSGPECIFWHPCNSWGHANSGDIRVLRTVFDFSACQCHLADFFHSFQIEARFLLIWHDYILFKPQWLNLQTDTSCGCCNLKGIRANDSSVPWTPYTDRNNFEDSS